MSEDYIYAVCIENARVLKPSGYCMRWLDTFGLVEGHHLRIAHDCIRPVDLIAWDSMRVGMGKRSRRRGDYLVVLQKAPIKAGSTWRDHAIPSRWAEKVNRSIHPHIKPSGLITRLIATTEPGDLVVDPAAGRGRQNCTREDPALKILGVDPGIHGACALVEVNGDACHVVDAIDIPTIGSKAKERLNVHTVQEWILQHAPHRAFIERGQALPRQGASSGYKFGRAVGALEAVIALCAIPFEIVEPSVWKRALRLKGKDKELSRQRALELFPRTQRLLARRKDHQRAEAMLLAYYGAGLRPEPALGETSTVAETVP
jgi:Holliday junction resolvasome RuvABC endonuclease subunit